jgi:SagB-type dehydrogenase family enzyme
VIYLTKNSGKDFMEKTKYKNLERSDQQKGLPHPPFEEPYDEDLPLLELPVHSSITIPKRDIKECIEGRRSIRKYSDSPLSLIELAWLLWATQGVKPMNMVAPNERSYHMQRITLRTVPSAGARHPFETYLLINRVDGVKKGLYRYVASKHAIQEMATTATIFEQVRQAAYNQSMVVKAAVTFIWAVVAYRMTYRYGERGYRYMHLDAGHVCQNLYLAAEPIDCGVCAIAAFHDDEMNKILKIDGTNQFTIYLATLGKTCD